jgi:hypothetical protein
VTVNNQSLLENRLPLNHVVPQGSVLVSKAFTMYAEDVAEIFIQHCMFYHLYADDMQGHLHCKPAAVSQVTFETPELFSADPAWCASKRLQLNAGKLKSCGFGTAANLCKLSPGDLAVQLGSNTIEPANKVRDLGVHFDCELNMKELMSRTVRMCIYHLRRLRTVCSQLGQDVTARLVSAFVLSRLDYYNTVLASLPAVTLAPLQRVLNVAARLILGQKPRSHIHHALRSLHWLSIQQRIEYKRCVLVHLTLASQAPNYLCSMLTPVPSRLSLRSAGHHDLVILRTRLKLGESAFGSIFRRISKQSQTPQRSKKDC